MKLHCTWPAEKPNYNPQMELDKGTRSAQQIHFFKNVSMLGGLMLAAVDTEGKPGVAWRARRAAKDVKREAKRLGHDARREARLAAKSIG